MGNRIKSSMDYTSLGCCALAFVLYLNTLNAGFVYDDRRAILGNRDVSGKTPWQHIFINDYWGTPLTDSGSHGSYRPLCVLSFKFNYILGGYTPWGYHLINNLMHCLATGLVVKLARQFLTSFWGILATGTLFAVHPIHTEAVAGIVGRADLAACICYLLTYITFLKHIYCRERNDTKQWWTLSLTILLAVCALLFKETAISALMVCGIFDILRGLSGFRDKNRFRTLSVLTVSLLTLIYTRISTISPGPKVNFSTADNPIAKMNSMWTRFLMFIYLPVFNFQLLIYPTTLSFDWGMDSIPRITSIWDIRNFYSFVFYVLLIGTLCKTIKSLLDLSSKASRIRTSRSIMLGATKLFNNNNNNHNNNNHNLNLSSSHSLTTNNNNNNNINKNINSKYIKKYSTYSNCSIVVQATQLNQQNSQQRKSRTKRKYHVNPNLLALNNESTNLSSIDQLNCYTCKHNLNLNHTSLCRSINNNNSLMAINEYQLCRCQSSLILTEKQMPAHERQLFRHETETLETRKLLYLTKSTATKDDNNNNRVTPRSSRSSSSCSNSTTSSNTSQISSCSSTISSCSSTISQLSATSTSSYLKDYNFNIGPEPYSLMPKGSQSAEQAGNNVVLIMSIIFIALPFLPATNLFFYVGFVVAERLLYLPSIGYCLAIGFGISKIMEWKWCKYNKRRKLFAILCMILLLGTFSFKTWMRNNDWYDEESLYRSAVQVNPPKALGNLGSVLSSQGRYNEAKNVLLEALKYRPNMADVHFNLGILHQNQQNFGEAVEHFQRAIRYRPNLAVAYLNLGTSLVASGRCREAANIFKDGTKVDGNGVRDRASHDNARLSSYLQLGNLYSEQNKLQQALAIYREALHSFPINNQREVLLNRIGDLFGKLQQWDEAEKYHRAALDLQPDNVAAHLSYGLTLAKNSSRLVEAEFWFRRALKLAPKQSSVHHHYAEFLVTLSRHNEALTYRLRAAEISPTDYTLIVAVATTYRLLDRNGDAEKWYRKAVDLRPEDPRAHTNLGAILHLLGKADKAAASYKEALRLQPDDPTTLANMAKLGIIKV